MPKCTFSGCDQNAFYGQLFNQPKFCKIHAPSDAGSVKKKCMNGECLNAVFTGGDICQRCMQIIIKADELRNVQLSKLDAAIKKENAAHVIVQQPTPTQALQAAAVPKKRTVATVPGQVAPTQPNIFAPKESRPASQPPAAPPTGSVLTAPAQKQRSISAGPKIVRTPDEPVKAAPGDLAVAKKRTQTPGRSKSTSSAAETKVSLDK